MATDLMHRLVQENNELFRRMQEIQERSEAAGSWSEEDRKNWDEANARCDVVIGDINRLEAAAKRAAVDNDAAEREAEARREAEKNADTPEARELAYDGAFKAFMRGGMDNCTQEQRKALMEHRASPQGVTVPADGGYLVPPGYRTVMTEAMKAYGGLINHANVITTSTGQPLQWPTNDDTSNVGAILNENTQISELGVTIGTKAIGAYTYTSKLVRVSLQLLQDSAFNLDSWLPRKLGERIGRAVATDLVNGTGTGMPTGLLPFATNSGVTLSTANLNGSAGTDYVAIYNAIIDLEHSIDPAYRSGDTRYLFNDKMLALLRKVKDGQNRPLWLPVPVPGAPATINGQPYSIDQAMPSSFPNPSRPILFGNFREAFIVRQVLDVQAVRLSERYADFLQVGFFGFMRIDSALDDANAVKALVIAS